MPIKMVALRRYYSNDDRRQYEAGQEFSVATEREAQKLGRRRQARLADKAMKAEPVPEADPPELDPPETTEATNDEPAPRRRGRPPKYERRDMTAED